MDHTKSVFWPTKIPHLHTLRLNYAYAYAHIYTSCVYTILLHTQYVHRAHIVIEDATFIYLSRILFTNTHKHSTTLMKYRTHKNRHSHTIIEKERRIQKTFLLWLHFFKSFATSSSFSVCFSFITFNIQYL